MLRFAVSLTLVAGCAASGDPCSGSSGVCIGLHVQGSLTGLDQLAFTIDRPGTEVQRSPDPARGFNLPVRVALFPPAGTSGTVHVSCDGTGVGELLGHGEADAALVNGHAEATLTLLAASGDMAVPDQSPNADLTMRIDLANCGVVTACLDGDGCCPSGCTNSSDKDCVPVCGNKIVEAGEVCDDGNLTNGDGCDPTCRFTGAMSTLSGVPGAAGWADGIAARFGDSLPSLASDGSRLWIADPESATIRELQVSPSASPTTLIGAPYDERSVDGTFANARVFNLLSLTYLSSANHLYFVESNGTSTVLRKADLTSHMVTTLSAAVIKDVPVALANDGTSIYYLSFGVNGSQVDKWTPGDASSTVFIDATTLGNSGESDCGSLLRTPGVTWLGCRRVVRVPDGGPPEIYAGTYQNGPPHCVDSSDRTMALFYYHADTPQLDEDGNLWVTDCNAIRQVAPADGGVGTYAGQLNMGGLADGPRASALFGKDSQGVMPLLRLSATRFYLADSQNAVIRAYDAAHDSIVTIAGSSPTIHAVDVRGSAAGSRFSNVAGVVSDGAKLYALGHAAGTGGTPRTLVSVDLTTGASSDLFTFAVDGRALVRIGSTLYVALADGSIHSIGSDGSGDSTFAGLGGNAKYPPADGAAKSAVIDPVALATDGIDLYFVDNANLIRKISTAAPMVSSVAGTQDAADIIDASGVNAHFANPSGLAFMGGALYTLDAVAKDGPTVVRRITLSTFEVKTIAGATTSTGDADGVGAAAQIAGAHYLASDGKSLFISDATEPNLVAPGQLSPTIRQLDPSSLSLTTLVGQRGVWTILNGTGTSAIVHAPGPLAYDAAAHSLYFFDLHEGVFQRID